MEYHSFYLQQNNNFKVHTQLSIHGMLVVSWLTWLVALSKHCSFPKVCCLWTTLFTAAEVLNNAICTNRSFELWCLPARKCKCFCSKCSFILTGPTQRRILLIASHLNARFLFTSCHILKSTMNRNHLINVLVYIYLYSFFVQFFFKLLI